MFLKVSERVARWARGVGGLARIRNRLLLLLATVLVPILLIEVVIYSSRFRELYRQAIQSNLEVSRAVSRVFASFVGDVLRQEVAIGLAVSVPDDLRPDQVRSILTHSREQYPALRDINWIHPRGRILYSSLSAAEGTMIADRDYFRQIIDGQDWSISDLVVSRTSGTPIFTINRAVRSDTGTLLGVISASVEPDRLETVLDFERGGGGAVLVVDRSGRTVYRYPQVPWTWESRIILDKYPGTREALQDREVSATTDRKVDGAKRMFAMVPIAPVGWAAGASRPVAEVVGPAVRALSAHAGLLLLVVLLSLVPAAAVARSISFPLSVLRQAVRSRAGGSFAPGAVGAPREIQELAEAFRQMDRERSAQERDLEVQFQRVKILASTMRSLARERSRSLERLGLLIDLSTGILAENEPAGLLARAAAAARDLLAADATAAAYESPAAALQVCTSGAGGPPAPDAAALREILLKLGGRSLLRLSGRRTPAAMAAAGWKSLIGARLTAGGLDTAGGGGLLWAARRERPPFTGEDEALLAQLASLVSLCLRNLASREAALQRAEEAEEGRRTLRTLMECVPEGIGIADAPDGRIRLLSEHGRQMAGREAAEPGPAWDFLHADGRTPAGSEELPLGRAIRTGETVVDEEWVLCRPDGATLPVMCNASPIRDPSGRITGAVTVFRDTSAQRLAREQLEERVRERTAELSQANEELRAEVAERRRVERELGQQREILQRIIDHIPVMLLIYSSDGRVDLLNREAERLLGWSLEEIRRAGPMEAGYPDPEARREAWSFMLQASQEWRDFTIRTRDGRALPSAWCSVRLPDGSRIGIGLDVTGRKQAEEKLLRYQRRLRALAAELATTAERERQKLATEVHDRIGQALSLSRMRLGMLRGRLADSQAAELDGIAHLLEGTIQDVRGLLFELYPPVLHHAGLEPALEWLAERFRERYGIEIDLENRIAGDSLGKDLQVLLFRSVQELLMNVVLHAQTDHARLRLGREDGSVVIEVEDGGAGFRPEEAERSSGFGIFSIQEQLAPLGGSLQIDSAPGKGTRVVLRAPAG